MEPRSIVVVVGGTVRQDEYARARLIVDVTGTLHDHARFRDAEVWSFQSGAEDYRLAREDGLAVLAAGPGVSSRRLVQLLETITDPTVLVVLPRGTPQTDVTRTMERMSRNQQSCCVIAVSSKEDRVFCRCERGLDGDSYFVLEHLA